MLRVSLLGYDVAQLRESPPMGQRLYANQTERPSRESCRQCRIRGAKGKNSFASKRRGRVGNDIESEVGQSSAD